MNTIIGIVTLIVALATLYVSYITYRFARNSEKKRKEAERQALQDEYDALMESVRFPMTPEQRALHAQKSRLEKALRRK